jgi:hypothetical protein
VPFPGDILTSVLRQKYVNAIRLLDQLVTVMERKTHSPWKLNVINIENKGIYRGKVILPSATRETLLSWISLIIEQELLCSIMNDILSG